VAAVSISARLDGDYLRDVRGRTDENGHFRLDGLPERGLALEFWGKGILRKEQPVAAVDREDLEVVIERAGRVAGTVVDGHTGQPLPDFRIRIGSSTGYGYSAEWVRGGKAFHDESGVFRIDEGVAVGTSFTLEASADGYGASIAENVVAVLDPDPAATTIALYPGLSIDGLVRDRQTANPVAGALVKAVSRGRPLEPSQPNNDLGRPLAETDAQGRFRLDNVGVGEVSLAVSHPDWIETVHGPLHLAAGQTVPLQEVELERGVRVEVDVRDAQGAPIPGADIELSGSQAATRKTFRWQTHADTNGKAEFERVAPGDYDVVLLDTTGGVPAWTFRRRVTVATDDCRVELQAKDGDATLVVTIDSPEPLPDGTTIMLMPAGNDPGSRFHARNARVQGTRTVIEWLPATELSVLVMSGNRAGSTKVTTLAGREVEAHVVLEPMSLGR
jgi:hypothetical protein